MLNRAFLFLIVPVLLVSCESTNSHRAGGGAFDDTYIGPILDGNLPIPDPESPANQSLEDWRNAN